METMTKINGLTHSEVNMLRRVFDLYATSNDREAMANSIQNPDSRIAQYQDVPYLRTWATRKGILEKGIDYRRGANAVANAILNERLRTVDVRRSSPTRYQQGISAGLKRAEAIADAVAKGGADY